MSQSSFRVLLLMLMLAVCQANIVLQDQKKRGQLVMTDDNIVWKGNLFDHGDSECAEHSVEHVWAFPPNHAHGAHYGGHYDPHHEMAFVPQSMYGWAGGHYQHHQMEHEAGAASSASGHWAQPSHAYYAIARPTTTTYYNPHSPFLTSAGPTSAVAPTSASRSKSPHSTVRTSRMSADSAFPLLAALFPSAYLPRIQTQSVSIPLSISTDSAKTTSSSDKTTGSKPNERKAIDVDETEDAAEQMITKQLMQEIGQDLFL